MSSTTEQSSGTTGDAALLKELTATTSNGQVPCIAALVVDSHGLSIARHGENAERIDAPRLVEMSAIAASLESNQLPSMLVVESQKSRTLVQPLTNEASAEANHLITVLKR